ncbi:MAG: hypothetical protein ABI416_03260 [Ginsengibacter sp.]
MAQFSSFGKNIDSLMAALAGFIIIILFTRHGGIGLCPDGVMYSTAAENLRANGKLWDFTNSPLVEFPLFYPVFLSSIMFFTGLNPLAFAPLLNAFLFGTIIYLSGTIMDQFLQTSKWYKRALLSCIALSPCLLEVYSMMWSETLFILLVLLFMMAMHRYFQSYSRRVLIAGAIIASMAAVTRYAGITIVGFGAILLLLDMNLTLRRKIGDIIIYSLISPLLLVINLTRNYAVTGIVTGNRVRSITTMGDNMHYAGSVFYDWLPFFNGHYKGAGLLALLLIAALVFMCVKQLLVEGRPVTYEYMAASFSLFYLLFMVVIASISKFETLNSRFLSPVFIPLIWACSNGISSLFKRAGGINKTWWVIGAVIFLSFQYGQLAADYETWDGVKDAGIPGYTEDPWKYSATVQFIHKNPFFFRDGYVIYSNAYDAVYFFTGMAGKFLPVTDFQQGVQNFLNERRCYVIWFNDGDNDDLLGLGFLVNTKKMKLLKQFNDGAIYGFGEL